MADLGVMLINKLRGRPIYGPLTGPVPTTSPTPAPPLTEREASIERHRMLTVLPGETQKFVEDILAWARAQGIPCLLGETHRDSSEQDEKAREGKTAIPEGKTGWHQYGRAFHLILYKPGTKQIDQDAYKIVGAEVRRRGGEWLGDKLLKTPQGFVIQDLAHFEYHPGLKLSSYRDTTLAQREKKIVDKRAARYG